jgi:hypothetical protein
MDDLVRPKEPDQDSRKEAKHRRSRSGAFWAILLLVPLAGIGWWLRTHCTASAAQTSRYGAKGAPLPIGVAIISTGHICGQVRRKIEREVSAA